MKHNRKETQRALNSKQSIAIENDHRETTTNNKRCKRKLVQQCFDARPDTRALSLTHADEKYMVVLDTSK